MKLLLVEDEPMLSKILEKGLKKCGYAVDVALDGKSAIDLYEINACAYDLILLDLNMPFVDGMSVLKHIREKDLETRILILSARSDVDDRIAGLDSGANDYLTKPFDFKELEARIRSLLRRAFIQQDVALECQGIVVDTVQKRVVVNGAPVELTKKEYTILEYLMMNRNRVISAEQLIEHVWDSDVDMFTNPLKFQIHSLKKKLAVNLDGTEILRNIRGQGYIIYDPEKEG